MKYFPVLDKNEFNYFIAVIITQRLLSNMFRVECGNKDYFYFGSDRYLMDSPSYNRLEELKVNVGLFLWPTSVVLIQCGTFEKRTVKLSRGQKFAVWKELLKFTVISFPLKIGSYCV